jgi:hypothetical protein
MPVLCEKNIVELEVSVEDVIGVEVVYAPQYLLDVEMSDVDG